MSLRERIAEIVHDVGRVWDDKESVDLILAAVAEAVERMGNPHSGLGGDYETGLRVGHDKCLANIVEQLRKGK